MAYLDLINEVLSMNDFDEIADIEDEYPPQAKQVKIFLNQVYKDIINKNLDWSWREKAGNVNLVAGITEYSLPADCDIDSIKRIKYADTLEEVLQISYNDFDRNMYPIASAININAAEQVDTRPTLVYVFNNKLHVYPVPGSSSTLTYRYQVIPSTLADNDDEPIIPEKYHTVLVYGASAMLKNYLSNSAGAAGDLALFNEGLQTMLSHNRKFLGVHPSAKITIRRRCI